MFKKAPRYIVVVTDGFRKFGLTIPLKNKDSQPLKDLFVNLLGTSWRKPKYIETVGRKGLVNTFLKYPQT